MPTVVTGNSANVTTPLIATIVNVTNNGGLFQVTTSAAHLFGDQDGVQITGVVGSMSGVINAAWGHITIIDATNFTLNGSTFSGAYTSGGFAIDVSLTPQFQVPSDGEYGTKASLVPALQSLADRTQWLINRVLPLTGAQYSLIKVVSFGATGGSFGTQFFTAGTWGSVTSFTGGHEQALGAGFTVDTGDIVDMSFHSTSELQTTNAAQVKVAFVIEASENGGSIGTVDHMIQLWGSSLPANASEQRPLAMSGLRSVSAGGVFQPYINGCFALGSGPAGASTINCATAWELVARVWRAVPPAEV